MRFKKMFIATLALSIATPAIVQSAEAAGPSFKDVPSSYYAHTEITDLVNRGVIKGFADNTYKPTKQVTRAEFAAFVARSLDLPSAHSNFKDVPKSAALYDGVSRAYKVGIIKGFADGTFKPSVAVNRQDMAVMIDRAMQLKGSYTKRKALNFSDSSKVGAYAKQSIERLYNYNVMGAYKGSTFSPTTIGTRAETARYLFNMLKVLEGGSLTSPITKSYKDMTLAELKQAYPKYNHVIVERKWKPEAKIVVTDMMAQYHKEINNPVSQGGLKEFADTWTPEVWFEKMVPGWKRSMAANYIDYPMVEVIAYNGKAYKDSFWMDASLPVRDTYIYQNMPSQPTGKGQFLIDIHRYDNDFVAYRTEDIKWDVLSENPVVIGDDYVVDLHAAFQFATGVTTAKGGLEIAYGDQKIILVNGSSSATVNGQAMTLAKPIQVKNGRAFGPISEIAKHIGLYVKPLPQYKRIEITNFVR